MVAIPAYDIALEVHAAGSAARHDSGARLSRALLSFLVLLMAALQLLPFEFATPDTLAFSRELSIGGTLVSAAMFVPYGFLSRRARTGRAGRQLALVILSAVMLAVALEAAQLFVPAATASVWHLAGSIVGAAVGAWACDRLHADDRGSATTVNAMLLQLPLMGLAYLLWPLLWSSSAAAHDDPRRLLLTIAAGMAGASLLGSIARATRAHTPDRPKWLIATVALAWGSIGLAPSLLLDWRTTAAGIAAITALAAWRGRWTAPLFIERRYEAPALLAASPFLAIYFIGMSVWPGNSFRTFPLVHLGVPTSEAGLALALPLIEMGIAATVLGYVIAEYLGRSVSSLQESCMRVLYWSGAVLTVTEAARSIFGYEGASLLRATLSTAAAVYGAWLYHLQRAHMRVVRDRLAAHG